MNTSVNLLASALRFQQRFAPPRNATLGCTNRNKKPERDMRKSEATTKTAVHVDCSPDYSESPRRALTLGPRLRPRIPSLLSGSLQILPEAPPPASGIGLRRRLQPQRRRGPTWREARAAAGVSRPHHSPGRRYIQPAPRTSCPGLSPRPSARPGGAAREPRRVSSPATCPLLPGRWLLRGQRLRTRPLLSLSSPSPSFKTGHHPRP